MFHNIRIKIRWHNWCISSNNYPNGTFWKLILRLRDGMNKSRGHGSPPQRIIPCEGSESRSRRSWRKKVEVKASS